MNKRIIIITIISLLVGLVGVYSLYLLPIREISKSENKTSWSSVEGKGYPLPICATSASASNIGIGFSIDTKCLPLNALVDFLIISIPVFAVIYPLSALFKGKKNV